MVTEMKFFISNAERKGTCYHEYLQGEWDGETFWAGDSLYLHDDFMCELDLYSKLFKKAIERFDPYRDITVTRAEWEKMLEIAREEGGQVAEFIEELRPWAEENFNKFDVFTILGI